MAPGNTTLPGVGYLLLRQRRLAAIAVFGAAMLVFQEQNGIYRFDRSLKLDVGRIRAAQSCPAAIEERYQT
ncbi:hypothetical protein ACIF8T_38120 [Streptomyces sp. NPDC085946]|uniref:hypothetical protein n=1 Tax=Streptomyces sp. NPDC085946 TaxID=3365744 RepID=UPI0037D82BC4